jgi:hypothetical protein
MLATFTGEFSYVLRLVAIMLLIPLDTSEAERIFSHMNGIETSERSSLGQFNLVNLMVWHYYAKDMKAWDVPVQEILKVFQELAEDHVHGRNAHVAAVPINYNYRVQLDSSGISGGGGHSGASDAGASIVGGRVGGGSIGGGSGGGNVGGGSGGGGSRGGGTSAGDLPESGQEVDATGDNGHFARWGEGQQEVRGEHAGTHLGTQRVMG